MIFLYFFFLNFCKHFYKIFYFLQKSDGEPKANIVGQNLPICSFFRKNKNQIDDWILDSGAIDHITFTKDLLCDIYRPSFSSVCFPNGNKTKIKSVGSTQLT